VLSFSQVAIRRGGKQLFAGASFTIHAGERVGVVGGNGCGKSSLFQLILGTVECDEGQWSLAGQPEIAHVAQEIECDGRDGLEHVLDGDAEYRQLLERLEHHDTGAQQRFEEIGGYGARARAAQLLVGLGFDEERMKAPANTLSGGWRMRISLARALMCRSDLLLLDEPSNHLDLDAVLWLEQWLLGYQGTLLLISHDREFLDRVIKRVVAIERARITSVSGNYSDYESVRAAQLGQQQAAYFQQQREIKHMQSFVDRFRAKATKARQAQSRLKALERLEHIAPAHVDSPFSFAFEQPDFLPNPLIRLEHASLGYGERNVLEDINLSISPGDRIGLLGLNGAGKSSLSRLLAGLLPVSGGEVVPAKHYRCGYFAQDQLELLNHEQSPADHFVRFHDLHDEQILRNFLGGFGFSGDRVFEAVAPFSGGEKARLVLALTVYAKPNLLILDEPTNHLDINMRHALTVALQAYAGALVLVSHDRHLLRACADSLLLVDAGKVLPFEHDLDHYPAWLSARRRNPTQPRERNGAKRKDERREAALRRQQLTPLRKSVSELERRLEQQTAAGEELEQLLADPGLYEEWRRDEMKRLLRQQADAQQSLEETELRLMEAMEALESAEHSLAGAAAGA